MTLARDGHDEESRSAEAQAHLDRERQELGMSETASKGGATVIHKVLARLHCDAAKQERAAAHPSEAADQPPGKAHAG